jgi:hypothetical protein
LRVKNCKKLPELIRGKEKYSRNKNIKNMRELVIKTDITSPKLNKKGINYF